ncbi:unnamed protein product [Allacma fusca]|uniref:Rab3 GTPase-activating protein catalytic subunit n=1 Tax=Allacma fusca TaxID=39272 RepID=A0A8J2ME53_9HEXA|nr:unnamed protein product [Allacma fusca]
MSRGLERGSPNSGTCLLNQKLQMLNCCIEKKIHREKKENEKMSVSEGIESPVEESEDEDDEFFDCDDNISLPPSADSVPRMNKPVGRLRKCGRLRLLKTGEPMYIPITQDPAPLTEDVVEEQAKILVELGNDAEGSELRAKMMSASLLSDMESFKAANPGAILDDFVRWYSPRDWIETDELDEYGNPIGSLSARMKVPGNLWSEVWSNAQSVPARRQRRLFDDTREAEKVLHWMSSRTLRDVSQLIFPCVIHAVTLKVLEEADKLSVNYNIPGTFVQQVTQLTRSIVPATSLSNNNSDKTESNVNNYRSCVMSSIGLCEKEITQIRSFQQKFPQVDLDEVLKRKASVQELDGVLMSPSSSETELIPNYIKVDGGAKSAVAEVIKEIFHMERVKNQNDEPEDEFKFGEPVRRVFILRYCPQKTTTTSDAHHYNQEETLPQRMSCLLKKNEFLLAGTFTTKTDLS